MRFLGRAPAWQISTAVFAVVLLAPLATPAADGSATGAPIELPDALRPAGPNAVPSADDLVPARLAERLRSAPAQSDQARRAFAAGEALFDPSLKRAQLEVRESGWFDECDDASEMDLHDVAVADSINDEISEDYGFLFTSCPGQDPRQAHPGTVVNFALDTDLEAEDFVYDYVVQMYLDDLTWALIETPSADPAGWSLEAAGDMLWAPWEQDLPWVVGMADFESFRIDSPAQFTFRVDTFSDSTPTQDFSDSAPEFGDDSWTYPNACTDTGYQPLTVETSAGRASAVAAAFEEAGFSVTHHAARSGTMVVSPVSDAQIRLVADMSEVTYAGRTVWFARQASNDPFPTAWAQDQLGLEAGWRRVAGAATRVAVLDSGVDAGRPDLQGRVRAGYDAVRGVPLASGRNSAYHPHGTEVVGLVAGTWGDGQGIAGVNRDALVHPVRTEDSQGCISDAAAIAGVRWLAQNPVDVAVMAWGGEGNSPGLASAVDDAAAAGTILVAAAGNDGGTTPQYPAAYANVISVGATGADGRTTDYSNRHGSVDVGAPGGDDADPIEVLGDFDLIDDAIGTSFAAPYVAGMLSLWADGLDVDTQEARSALLESSRDTGALWPVPDLDALLQVEDRPDAPPDPPGTLPGFDGDPATTERLLTSNPLIAAVTVSQDRFDDGTASHAVVARVDIFADALSGAALAHDGPMLFTRTGALGQPTHDELERVLADGAPVYLLGGEAAISPAVEQQIRSRNPGREVVRVAGQNRFETSSRTASLVVSLYGEPDRVLLARGYGPASDPNGSAAWADAVAGGGYAADRGIPIVLTATGELRGETRAFLGARVAASLLVSLLGGEAAVSHGVNLAVIDLGFATQRVGGAGRAETAVEIARVLWGQQPDSGARRNVIINPWDPAGWALGMAGAGVAADADAPILALHGTEPTPATEQQVTNSCPVAVDLFVIGNATTLPDATVAGLDARDGVAC